jgi:hypothetical protein
VGYTQEVLDEVRSEVQVPQAVIDEVRKRRDLVRSAAHKFTGAKRTFPSGSATHWTAIGRILATEPGVDGDCGVVLSRAGQWWELGPDGAGVAPSDVVEQVREFIGPQIREEYADAKLYVTGKRAILVRFAKPVEGYEDDDPTVDLIVALDRRDAPGLWIPNLNSDSWDASHPEQHNALLNGESKSLRVVRARVVRLGKAWSRSCGRPVSGFNIEALAWESVESGQGVARALLAFFEHGASSLKAANTKDPAGVSGSIKLLKSRDTVVAKFASARDNLRAALDSDDDEEVVRDALRHVFPRVMTVKEAMAKRLRHGNSGLSVSVGAGLSVGTSGTTLKTTRAFGDAG